ncbi:mannose-6-phosphate isomerase-like protein (cupin superfamily) [Paenibacillus forsythiae]|uniref:Mannose-6-phosphate isomerase-like protein (Cupin superfamily) n=1 Tax=Paenibacillus forsythiae TaxID=365616 RepID=A0ABU3H4Z9_9BACL|nr:cupin domain-containing protein [Paenibacillus forsythiae]MDT3425884.1 mannose-6-phosphate isomerase-like protein (cupin superfamily) [Paenibacillus forsythiae]
MSDKKYSVYHIGPFQDLAYTDQQGNGKILLKELAALTSAEISVNRWAPGEEPAKAHKHINNEEIYFILKGEGEILVDDEVIPVKEGSVVRIDPDAARRHRNASKGDLIALVIQAHKDSLRTWTFTDGYFD